MTCKLLIVEGDDNWNSLYEDILEFSSCRVISSQSVDDAIKIIRGKSIDVVLMEIRIKGKGNNNFDGMRLIHYINSHHPSIKIIVNTDSTEYLKKEDAYKYFNIKDYFNKGIDDEDAPSFSQELLLQSVRN